MIYFGAVSRRVPRAFKTPPALFVHPLHTSYVTGSLACLGTSADARLRHSALRTNFVSHARLLPLPTQRKSVQIVDRSSSTLVRSLQRP
jgi:hypothetical protein